MQRREYDAALDHLEIAVKIDPLNKSALFTLSKIRAKQGEYEEALGHLMTLAEMNPTDKII